MILSRSIKSLVRLPRTPRSVFYLAGAMGLIVSVTWLALLVIAIIPTFIPGWGSTSVISNSMVPALRSGDVVSYRPAKITNIHAPTIVVFFDPERASSVVHRVVSNEGEYLITKGDANAQFDTRHVAYLEVQGVGFMVVPWVGLPIKWWATGQRYLSLLLASFFFISAWLSGKVMDGSKPPWISKPAPIEFLRSFPRRQTLLSTIRMSSTVREGGTENEIDE